MSLVDSSFAAPLFSLALPHWAGTLLDVAWSASGMHLAAVTSAGWIFLWDGQTGEIQQHKQVTRTALLSITWAREDTALAVGSQDGIVRFLDAQLWVTSTYPFEAPVIRIAWAPHVVGACIIVSGQQVTVLREDTRSTRRLHYPSAVLDAVWSPDGRQIALLCVDGLVEIWQARQNRLQQRFVTRPRAKGSLLWDQASRTLIVAGEEGCWYSYPLPHAHPFPSASSLPSMRVTPPEARRPVHDPTGRYLATTGFHAVHVYERSR